MSCADVSRASPQALARRAVGCLIAAVLIHLAPHSTGAEEPRSIRAVALATPDVESADATRRLADARESGVDTVFLPVSIHGQPEDDAIASLIRDAHDRGLRVHASVPILFAAPAGPLPLSRDHVIYRRPEWLMVPRELALELRAIDARSPDYLGRLARWTRGHADRTDGLYLSPLHAEAVAFVIDAVRRLALRHAFDGIHFDALRFPDGTFDYSAGAMDAFRADMRRSLAAAERVRVDGVEAIDPFAYPNELADEWRRFRVTRLTSLVAQLRSAVRAVRPGAIVSASAVPGAERAAADHFQDWRTWADNGFVDALSGPVTRTATLLFSYETLIDPVTSPASAVTSP